MKKTNHNGQMAQNVLFGMAAGAAVSAAGMYYASNNQRELKKMGKKITHTAENAMQGMDKMMVNMMRNF